MNNKLFHSKKMIGKRVAVISDYKNFSFWLGVVDSVKDENTFIIKNANDNLEEVSIFDIRNPTQEII